MFLIRWSVKWLIDEQRSRSVKFIEQLRFGNLAVHWSVCEVVTVSWCMWVTVTQNCFTQVFVAEDFLHPCLQCYCRTCSSIDRLVSKCRQWSADVEAPAVFRDCPVKWIPLLESWLRPCSKIVALAWLDWLKLISVCKERSWLMHALQPNVQVVHLITCKENRPQVLTCVEHCM